MSETREPPRLLIGAMSGTSADGVDVALVQITGRGLGMRCRLVHHHSRAYDAALRARIFTLRTEQRATLPELAELARLISLTYAAAVNETLLRAQVAAADVAAIAAHGQTLYHAPPNTIQWLDPALLAHETRIKVVSDFRRADCAAGGQGAPLVPFADALLFAHPTRNRVLLNLGGIANITFVPAGPAITEAALADILAFDTGPANCVLDHLVRQAGHADGIDRDGERSTAGQADAAAVERMLADPYFSAAPPKSTDGPQMIAIFEKGLGPKRNAMPLPDLLATACLFSARGIARGLALLPHSSDEIVVSGGGEHNRRLMLEIARATGVAPMPLHTLGFPSAAKEALAFALLGAATLDGEASNVPAATGARQRVVLGSITPYGEGE